MKSNTIILTLLIMLSVSLNAAFREDVTLHVPGEYETIHDALYDLDEKTISKDVTVTIKLEDGTYNYDKSIIIDHPYSNRIRIVGNTTTPSSCVINFNNTSSGFELRSSKIFIDGFKIQGPSNPGSWDSAIKADNCVCINLGSNIHISGFDIGVCANSNSIIHCSNIKIENCSSWGILAHFGGRVWANGAHVSSCGDDGVRCARNSTVDFANGTSINNSGNGIQADNQSHVYAPNSNVSGNAAGNFNPNVNQQGNTMSIIQQ